MNWLVGLVLAVVTLGPALAPGPLFNLDLVLPDRVPVPRGVWGLGPELPRRVPLWLPVAWLAPVLPADLVGKALMVACIAGAYVGAVRFTSSMLPPSERAAVAAVAAGFLYTLNPFLLTRLAVGHLMVAVPMALLPWVLPTLLRPDRDLGRTFLAVFALAFAGHYGGVVSGLVVLAGLARRRGRRAGPVLAATVLAQLPWLVPGLLVYAEGSSMVDAAPFTTSLDGLGGAARLLAGHGFWEPLYQVGWPGGWPVAVIGIVLAGLGVLGTRDLPPDYRAPLVGLAVLGLLAAAASATPGLSVAFLAFSRTPVGSVVREGQRLLPLYLVWLAPAAALGARRVATGLAGRGGTWSAASTVTGLVPALLALALVGGSLWGIDPRLRPVQLPSEWREARELIDAAPGTVAALPWHQYFNLEIDGIRRVVNPLPIYLGGDVLASSDPELPEADRRERADPREATMDRIVAAARAGRPVGEDLARLGVRWVVLLHEVDWLDYSNLRHDPGLERRLYGESLEVYAVTGWRGLVVDGQGAALRSSPVIEPLVGLDPSGPATYFRPAAGGWLRGTEPATATPDGVLALPAGRGPVWYLPAVVAVASAIITYVLAAVAAAGQLRDRYRRMRTRPHPCYKDDTPSDNRDLTERTSAVLPSTPP